MTEYSAYQLKALKELANFRNIFYDDRKSVKTDILNKSASSFVELFCQHHFANSDYSVIQQRPEQYMTVDDWINNFDIDTLLKSITYIIWTNKSHKGYLVRKIKDKTVHKYLCRLNDILDDELQKIKVEKRKSAFNIIFQKENNYPLL